MEWKERQLIGREYTNNIGKHLAGMLKVRCAGADERCFQNAQPVTRLRSIRMTLEELGAAAQDPQKCEAVVKACVSDGITRFSKWTVSMSAAVLGVGSTLLEEQRMASGFQRFTELVQCAACLLIAHNSMKFVLTVSPSVPVTGIAYSVCFLYSHSFSTGFLSLFDCWTIFPYPCA